MQVSLSQRLTAQFYDWECRGRGWLLADYPIELEPPFHPFFFHAVGRQQVEDDGVRRNILVRGFNALFAKKVVPEQEEREPIEPYSFDCNEPLRICSISLPKGYKVDIEETEQLLVMLSNCQYPMSFEIVASHVAISLQFVCREPDMQYLLNQLKAYFPQCIVKERADPIEEIVTASKYGACEDYGFRQEFMRPLVMADSFDLDPFIGLFAALEQLGQGEHAVIQVLFKGAVNPWAESIMRSVQDSDGKSFFTDAPEMVPLAKDKVAHPLFGVTIKVMGTGRTQEQALQVQERVGKSLVRVYTDSSNSLIELPSTTDTYNVDTRIDDLLLRETHRLGMLLNSRELATLVHLPSASVTTNKLERDTRKTKTAPSITEGHTLVLGMNEHMGVEKAVTVSDSQRLKHTHIIGATGTGKSTFLLNLISQDIQNGKGLCVLDPHGDLIENILAFVPPERIQDVILIDPADGEYPVGFNILSAHSEIEKDILSSDLVAVFRRLSTSWGDQMNSVFANAILALLESKQGGTLVDLRRFLVEKAFRDNYLKSVPDPNIVYYWQKEYPLLKSNSIGSILTRLDTFLRPKLIRNMVAQKKGLDFEHILDSRKILLVKLSQGLIGTENSYLLGTFFVTKMYQAAMARQIKSKEDRNDFLLYIDEFQNFITPSMSAILSGARKYHLGLILAHQDMTQLNKYDTELASAVVANAGTRVCFRLGDTDAKRFAQGFTFFEASDLENLHTGEAIARIERPDFDFNLNISVLQFPDAATVKERQQHVLDASRAQYGTPREEVEAQLYSLLETSVWEQEPTPKPQPKKKVEQPVPEEPKPEPVPIPKQELLPLTEEAITENKERLIRQKADSHHRYLQNLIKKMAELRGYKAKIEEPTPDGKGRVDVALERNSQRIAVEVCVTTETDWEMHNIEKCLAAGYTLVVECSSDKKTIEAITKKVQTTFDETQRSKILIFEPEQLFEYLDKQVAQSSTTEVRMKGYRVKVEYTPSSAQTAEQKLNSINKTVSEARRNKKK